MIPLATTTITVSRVEATDVDPYDAAQPSPTTIASGVRAVVGTPSASVALSSGDKVVYAASLRCDPVDVQPGDTVTDSTGTAWTVLWAREVNAVGLDFMEGQLRLVQGNAA